MFDEVFAFLKTKVFANGTHKHRRFSTISSYYQYTSSRLNNAHEISAIAIIDLVRYRSEGELPYRPYSDALH